MQIPLTCDKCAVASRSCSPKKHLFHLTPGIQASIDARIQTGGGKLTPITAGRPKLDSGKNCLRNKSLVLQILRQCGTVDSIHTQTNKSAPWRCEEGI